MPFIIKSYHADTDNGPKRIHFWQTPWILYDKDTDTHKEVGGWMLYSGHATIYESEDEAKQVNAMRYLFGQVDTVRLTQAR